MSNVGVRRGLYLALLVVGFLVFAFAMVDIFVLEEAYYWYILIAFAALFLIGLLLLIGASPEKEEKQKALKLASEEHLHCPHCAHVFYVGTPKNTKKWKRGVTFSCPECGNKGVMPPGNATPVEAVVPGGNVESRTFQCKECGEGWSIGVIGHRLKKKVAFDACPSCGSADHIHAVSA